MVRDQAVRQPSSPCGLDEIMISDLRFAFRQLLRQPGFTLLAACSLALGIGLVTTQFSLIDAILLRGLPIPDAQRLVHVSRMNPQSQDRDGWEAVPYRDYLALREQQTSLESVAAVTQIALNLSGYDRVPSHQPGARASANLLEVLGVRPQLGRWFEPAEDQPGQALFVVLSHGLWQEGFGGDPLVLGRSVNVNGESGTIIGVMPPRYTFPADQRLWINLRAVAEDPRERLVDRAELVGKLRPGISRKQAKAEFDALAAMLAQLYPETNQGYTRMNVEKFTYAYAGGGTEPILYLMLGMTLFTLALACVNVANMLLSRASRRARELAVRAALGASRWRLIRQLLLEALAFAAVGAVGGLLIAQIGVGQLHHQFVDRMNVPGWFEFRLDHRVLGVAVLVTLLAGVLAGIMPAWQAARVDVNESLKDDSRGASSLRLGRLSRWLVTAQIGFSSTLLVAACVLGWTVYLTRQANVQYDPDRLLSGRIELHDFTHATPADRVLFYRNLIDRLENQPGVETVAVTSRNLISPGVSTRVAPEGKVYAHENEQPSVWLEVVSSAYFELLGVGVVRGRMFDSRDHLDTPRTALVNESFAQQFWPGRDPVGLRFRSNQTQDHWVTIVGVVPDLQMQSIYSPPNRDAAGFYLAQNQMGWGWLNLFVRTKGDPRALIEPVRRAVAGIDPNQPVHSIGTLAEHTARQSHGFTIVGVMAGIFALVTLFLGAVGVYGVTSFTVNRRRREFGVRMALGATVGNVLQLVLRQGARQIVTGLVLGLIAAIVITRPMGGIFGDELVNSPLIYALVALLIGAVGLLALWVPARRATRVDPMEALRSE
jgi:putative ABC transport system permease protein